MAQVWAAAARRAGIVLAILAAGQMALVPAQADVGGELNDFFNDVGGAGNAYGPTAFQGQSAGYYTGGGVWMRFPSKQLSPVNIQLPSVKAGCGGIDMFGGSFSFINTDQIVAMLKGVASNALGFAFQLAIKSISPQISQTIEEMAQKIEKLNQMNISSCEAAQGLVAGLWGESQGRDSEVCKAIANSQGFATDWAKARQDCNAGGQRTEIISKNGDEAIPSKSYNYTWHMLEKSYPSFDREFKEYLMSLVGTIIYQRADTDEGSGTVRYVGHGNRELIQALLLGTSGTSVLRCDDTENCLEPAPSGTVSISQAQALQPRVAALIGSMAAKVRSNEALTPEELGILGGTSVPLYKIITVNAAAQLGGMTEADIQGLAEIVAVDMLEQIIQEFYGYVQKAQGSFNEADKATLAQWREQLQNVSKVLDGYSYSLNERLVRTQTFVEKAVFLERTLRNAISPQMSAALSFRSGAAAQGLD
jgi:conjugative transfer pilus assembly protein TraH